MSNAKAREEDKCPDCGGTGMMPGHWSFGCAPGAPLRQGPSLPCPACDGSGRKQPPLSIAEIDLRRLPIRNESLVNMAPDAPSNTLTIEKLRAMARSLGEPVRPLRILVSRHAKDDGNVLKVDWKGIRTFGIADPEWEAMCGPRTMVQLARGMRARGHRPVRLWKRHEVACYEFQSIGR